jgi:D-arabinose 1-dehydrogenase-like Zn-dependent alcohol dehydrogenase
VLGHTCGVCSHCASSRENLCDAPVFTGYTRDGLDFLRMVPEIGIVTETTCYPLQQANEALADLRAGRFEGAAVLIP